MNVKAIMLLMALVLAAGCESTTGHWVRLDATDAQAKADYDQCFNAAISSSDGKRSTNPFDETLDTKRCMERKGYQFLPDEAVKTKQSK